MRYSFKFGGFAGRFKYGGNKHCRDDDHGFRGKWHKKHHRDEDESCGRKAYKTCDDRDGFRGKWHKKHHRDDDRERGCREEEEKPVYNQGDGEFDDVGFTPFPAFANPQPVKTVSASREETEEGEKSFGGGHRWGWRSKWSKKHHRDEEDRERGCKEKEEEPVFDQGDEEFDDGGFTPFAAFANPQPETSATTTEDCSDLFYDCDEHDEDEIDDCDEEEEVCFA